MKMQYSTTSYQIITIQIKVRILRYYYLNNISLVLK